MQWDLWGQIPSALDISEASSLGTALVSFVGNARLGACDSC
jgi:hypothetical protein